MRTQRLAIFSRYVMPGPASLLLNIPEAEILRRMASGEWARDREWLVAPDRHRLIDLCAVWHQRLPPELEPTAIPDDGVPTALYRHFDAAGVLLYVGISLDVIARLSAHANSSHWAGAIARVDITRYPSRKAARLAERHAIRTERPLHNIAGAP